MPHRTPGLSSRSIANGKSAPARTDALSLLTLPAEIRNSIYKYLLVHEEPIRVCVMTLEPDSRSGQTRICTSPYRIVEYGLLSSCRQLYHEAATFFYFNNTFHLNGGIEWRTMPCWHTVFSSFCESLGSQAKLVRKIMIDRLPLPACRRVGLDSSLGVHFQNGRELESLGLVLKTIWNLNVTADISFDTPLLEGDLFDGPTVNRIIKSFATGALNGKQNRRSLAQLYVSKDRSHGAMVWHTSETLRKEQESKFEADSVGKNSHNRFSVEHSGEVLRLIGSRNKRGLLNLPLHIHKLLLDYILDPGNIVINLDKPSTSPFSLAYVTRFTLVDWRETILWRNKLVLSTSTTQLRSAVSGLDRLRRLMRTTFGHTSGFYATDVANFTIAENSGKGIEVILNFELQQGAGLEDLRISVLPLIMELAHASWSSRIIVRIRIPENGARKIVAEHSLDIDVVRENIVKALKLIVSLHAEGYNAEVWINGFGKVMETSVMASNDVDTSMLASDLVLTSDSLYRLRKKHPRDVDWTCRSSMWEDRSGCVFADCAQFFPFPCSLLEQYRYLIRSASQVGSSYDGECR
jgi:hypothetical protein